MPDVIENNQLTSEAKVFCFGYGYSCDYLGHALLQAGCGVAGTTRSMKKRDTLRKRGIDSYIFDAECPLPDSLYVLQDVTHLVISTPPNDDGDPAFLAHAHELLKLPKLKWVGYLSTTGVYGDRDGGWVDEDSELQPNNRRGDRRVKAEDQWLDIYRAHELPVHVFRLSGIYGPGRSALDTIRAGVARRIAKPGHAFSRIHVEDIAQILIASMQNPNPGGVYNVCDDVAAPSHEVIAYACDLLKRPVPELIAFDEADLSPMARSFYKDNKRVKNDRIKQELGVNLKYESYVEGLRACLEAEDYALSLFKGMRS